MEFHEIKSHIEKSIGLKEGQLNDKDFKALLEKMKTENKTDFDLLNSNKIDNNSFLEELLTNSSLSKKLLGILTIDNSPIDNLLEELKKKLKNK